MITLIRTLSLSVVFLFVTSACYAEIPVVLPGKSTPPPKSETEKTEISLLFAALDKCVEAEDKAGCRGILGYLYLLSDDVPPVFLPPNFASQFEIAVYMVRALENQVADDAKMDAARFMAYRARIVVEGFFENNELLAIVKTDTWLVGLCRKVVAFEWFGEASRIAALRTLFVVEPPNALSIADEWHKSDNAALRLAAIYILGYSPNNDLGAKFAKLAAEKNLNLEFRVEYALSAERLGAEGRAFLGSVLLSSSAPPPIRFRAVAALKALGKEKASSYFVQLVIAETSQTKLLLLVVETLAEWNVEEITPHLSRFLNANDAGLVRAAVRAVRLMKVSRFYSRIASLLDEERGSLVHVECIQCLGEVDAKEYLPKVAEFLFKRDFKIRLEAALAVQMLWGKDFGLKANMDEETQEVIIRRIRTEWQEFQKSAPSP